MAFRLLFPNSTTTPTLRFDQFPPKNVEAQIDVKQGSIVDVVHKYGWWSGCTVVKEIEDDKYFVLFDSKPDIIQFKRKYLRPHLEWVDEKSWVIPERNAQFLRWLNLEPMFCPGAMVEVKSKLKKAELEVVWVPAMIIKEIEEDDEKKYIVKFCNDHLPCKGDPKIPNKTIHFHSVRPRPALLLVEDYLLGEDVEVLHGSAWRQGRLKRRIPGVFSEFVVMLEATKEELSFKHSDIRPLMKLQEDGTWKHSRETPSTQGLGSNMVKSVMNAKESDLPASTSPDIAATPLKQTGTETQRKPLPRNENCLRNGSAPEKEINRDNDRKRKREELQNLCSVANVEETGSNDTTMQSRETPSTRGLGNKMVKSVMNAKEPDPPASASPDIAATPLKQTATETQRKPLPRNQTGLTNDSTPENKNNRENDRKRKRGETLQNVSSVATVEETEANDTPVVLPFEKKLPIWKKVESMEIFKKIPQSPHFSTLVGSSEDSREVSAFGLMLTFSCLLEEVKDLQLDHPRSSLISLNASLAELEKHGFNVKAPRLRISKLSSLRNMQTKKLGELKDAEKVTTEKERVKVENERKILELQRLNLEVDKEIAQSKSCEAMIAQKLEDVKFQFQTITSTPW